MHFRYFILFIAVLAMLPYASAEDDQIFAKDTAWEILSEGHQFAEGMAWDSDGHFYFTDVPRSQLFKINHSTGRKTLAVANTEKANGIAFGPDGRLYGCSSGADGITAWNISTWKKEVYGLGAKSNDIAILSDGSIYFTDPGTSSVWRIDGASRNRTLAIKLDFRPNGIALSPDGRSLYVASFFTDTIYAWSLDESGQPKGGVSIGYILNVPSDGEGKLDGMQVLPDGRLVAGTALGIQIAVPFDQAKTSRPLIHHPDPENGSRCNYVRISPDGKWLYACFVNDVRRRLISTGLKQKTPPQKEQDTAGEVTTE